MKKVAVVILNWNGARMLQKYLPSVIAHTNETMAEVIVADNGSDDHSMEIMQNKFPQIKTIELDQNYGFAEGYNRALLSLNHEYFVLLNSDIEVPEGWLEPMINHLDKNPGVAACQPKIKAWKSPDMYEYAGASGGFIDQYGYPFCRGRIMSTVEPDTKQYDDAVPIMWASGACLVIRSGVYKTAGGLDGGFFAHMEEIDLCWRIKNMGWQIMVYPETAVYHLGGGTLPNNSPRKLFLNYRNNLLLLHKNLTADRYSKTMRMRFMLDWVSAVLYLLQFKPAYTLQVFKARKAYRQMKPQYVKVRENLEKQRRVKTHPEIYPRSIVWDYFVKHLRRFSQLKFINPKFIVP